VNVAALRHRNPIFSRLPASPHTPPKPQDTITRTLALLKPDHLFPAWKCIDLMAQQGEINPEEARRWKEGIYGLMQLWGLEADDLTGVNGLRLVMFAPIVCREEPDWHSDSWRISPRVRHLLSLVQHSGRL
jgi:hypothetical protein